MIKVWLENKVDRECEVNEEKMAKKFLKYSKGSNFDLPLERRLAQFLSVQKIKGKTFVWDKIGFDAIVHAYECLKRKTKNIA